MGRSLPPRHSGAFRARPLGRVQRYCREALVDGVLNALPRCWASAWKIRTPRALKSHEGARSLGLVAALSCLTLLELGCLRSPLEPDAPAAGEAGRKPARATEQVEWFPVEQLPTRPLPLVKGLRHPGRAASQLDIQLAESQQIVNSESPVTTFSVPPKEELATASPSTVEKKAVERHTDSSASALSNSNSISSPPRDGEEKLKQNGSTPRQAASRKEGVDEAATAPSRVSPNTTTPSGGADKLAQSGSMPRQAAPQEKRADDAASAPSRALSDTTPRRVEAASPDAARPEASSAISRQSAAQDLAEATPRIQEEAETGEDAQEVEERVAQRPRVGSEARFQVQIMSTSDPEGAEDMRLQAEQLFPSEAVEVVWDPPNYKVRVGGAASMEAAQELKRRALRLGFTNAWVVPRRTN